MNSAACVTISFETPDTELTDTHLSRGVRVLAVLMCSLDNRVRSRRFQCGRVRFAQKKKTRSRRLLDNTGLVGPPGRAASLHDDW